LFGTAAPKSARVDGETSSVELGTNFTASTAGMVVGVRYWKTAENAGTHVGNLWDRTGKRLATATFSSESASGWQSVLFAKPVEVKAGARYVASYLAPAGRYSTTVGFVPSASASKHLSTPHVSGVYSYGKTSTFPNKTWKNSGYWADVLFVPAAGSSTPTPSDPAMPPTTGPTPTPTPTPTPIPTTSPTPTPTPTPTTAPTPPPGDSASTAFGGPGNTGPAAGGFNPTTAYTGPMTITTAGTVIQNKIIPPGLRVDAPNVTIEGNVIAGPTDAWSVTPLIFATAKSTGVKVLHNELRGNSATIWQGNNPVNGVKLLANNSTFNYNNMYWVAGDGLSIYGSGFTGIGNWVHDFVVRTDGEHYDAFHWPTPTSSAFRDILIRDNRIEMWITNAGASGMTAVLGLPDGTLTNTRVDHNLFAGGNYAVYQGDGVAFTNNLFWTKFSPKVGYFGVVAHLAKPATFTGNAYTHDGATPGKAITTADF
jgi:hypothetical protein